MDAFWEGRTNITRERQIAAHLEGVANSCSLEGEKKQQSTWGWTFFPPPFEHGEYINDVAAAVFVTAVIAAAVTVFVAADDVAVAVFDVDDAVFVVAAAVFFAVAPVALCCYCCCFC